MCEYVKITSVEPPGPTEPRDDANVNFSISNIRSLKLSYIFKCMYFQTVALLEISTVSICGGR